MDFCVENSHYDSTPYPAFTTIINGLTENDYYNGISEGLHNILKYKLNICSLVIDGCLAQKKAISSIINNTRELWIKKLLIVPCLCHKIHNSFKRAVNNDANLSCAIDEIHSISILCLEHIKEIGAVCPSHVSTRCIYDFDIVEFILKYSSLISQITEIPESIIALRNCLAILKQLIKIFENPSTQIGHAYPWIKHAIYALEELSSTGNEYANIIRNSLEQYTLNSHEVNGLLMTSYIMTPEGHDYFLNQLITQEDDFKKINNLNLFKIAIIEEEIDDEEEPIDILETETIDHILLNEDEFTNQEEEVIEEDNEMERVINDNVLNITYSIDYRSGLLEPVFSFIRNWGSKVIQDETKRKTFYSSFHTFATNTNDFLKIDIIGEKNYDWLHIRTIKNLEILGDFGVRLQATGCSEAACERVISAQRFILNSRNLRMRKELVDCRLKIMRGNI